MAVDAGTSGVLVGNPWGHSRDPMTAPAADIQPSEPWGFLIPLRKRRSQPQPRPLVCPPWP